MAIVVKFVCDGDIRRTRVSSLGLEEIQSAVQQTFADVPEATHAELKYRDDEDDLCLLNAATHSDFAALYEHSSSVRIEVTKKASSTSQPRQHEEDSTMGVEGNHTSSPSPHADHSSGPHSMPPPFIHFLKHIMGSLQNINATQNSDAMASLFVHFAPLLLQNIAGHHQDIDRLAGRRPELAKSIIQALKDGLEPFPQMQEALAAVESLSETDSFAGVGAAVETLLRAMMQLPADQQRDIASILVGGVLEKFLQDLLNMSAGHAEHPHMPMHGCPFGKGWGKGKFWGKGWGKGWGHGGHHWHGHHHHHAPGHWWSKGWGKGHDSSSTTESDMSSTTDSDKSSVHDVDRAAVDSDGERMQARREAKHAAKRNMREAYRESKRKMHEAKKQFKALKAAKKELKKVKKEHKEQKAARRARHQGQTSQEVPMEKAHNEPQSAPMDFTFPVEVADGRKLRISWNRGDCPEQVAAQFAQEHQIYHDELPEIVAFIQHATAVAGCNSEAVAAGSEGTAVAYAQADRGDAAAEASSDKMDVTESASGDKSYAGCSEESLQTLEQMGFGDRELNMQMLLAHDGNLQRVLDQLL